jgi:ElaB/YqjD/DUF883 family membrane-anchored ribosome-binding protein
MNTNPFDTPPFHPLPEAATDSVRHAGNVVEDTLTRTGGYVRQHPLPAVLGSLAFGAALGYLIVTSLRPKPSFRERLAKDPVHTIRDAVLLALAPATQRLHQGYDSVRDLAGQATDTVQDYLSSHPEKALANQCRSLGNRLKFW